MSGAPGGGSSRYLPRSLGDRCAVAAKKRSRKEPPAAACMIELYQHGDLLDNAAIVTKRLGRDHLSTFPQKDRSPSGLNK